MCANAVGADVRHHTEHDSAHHDNHDRDPPRRHAQGPTTAAGSLAGRYSDGMTISLPAPRPNTSGSNSRNASDGGVGYTPGVVVRNRKLTSREPA